MLLVAIPPSEIRASVSGRGDFFGEFAITFHTFASFVLVVLGTTIHEFACRN
jgi:hypothetical protein